MINLSKTIKPLVLVQTPHLNTYELQELIHDYLIENSEPSHDNDQLYSILDTINDYENHTAELTKYLQKHNTQNLNFKTIKGYFYSHELGNHFWINSGNLIIDITITRFNHFPQIDEHIWNMFGNYSYIISDNINHPLHSLYSEEL
jgi:hypothetical protein